MLKMSAGVVLARDSCLTDSAAFTNVTRGIPRVVNLRGSTYGSLYVEPLRHRRSPTRARPQT
ncbi:MAG: hypothetical protein GDA66_02205 [Nitrospira sp. CR1.2]|nr:hypothetical protein [Nitrospira sp. CR1.2]